MFQKSDMCCWLSHTTSSLRDKRPQTCSAFFCGLPEVSNLVIQAISQMGQLDMFFSGCTSMGYILLLKKFGG